MEIALDAATDFGSLASETVWEATVWEATAWKAVVAAATDFGPGVSDTQDCVGE